MRALTNLYNSEWKFWDYLSLFSLPTTLYPVELVLFWNTSEGTTPPRDNTECEFTTLHRWLLWQVALHLELLCVDPIETVKVKGTILAVRWFMELGAGDISTSPSAKGPLTSTKPNSSPEQCSPVMKRQHKPREMYTPSRYQARRKHSQGTQLNCASRAIGRTLLNG